MDIVDRLREPIIADAFEAGKIQSGIIAERLMLERLDAADEIDRLRDEIIAWRENVGFEG